MEKVTAYKLSDGRIVEDENEALKLEREIVIKDSLYEYAKLYLDYTDEKAEDFAEEIYSTKEYLLKALGETK